MSALPPREGLLIEALTANTAINTALSGEISTRIYQTFPAARVTLLGGPGRILWNTGQTEFQVEVWGAGSEPADELEAGDIIGTIEGEIENLPGTYTLGRIAGAYSSGDILHSPDIATSRERFILTIGLLIQ